jgi:uncharacterized protein (DUF1499 family)
MRLKPTPSIARWTTRVAVFALALTVVAMAAHRFGNMPTLTAFNLFVLSILAAGVALILGVIAAVIVWRQGTYGAMRVSFGILVAAGLIGWPAAFLGGARGLPTINDVTTDPASPPKFTDLAKKRGPGSNSPVYPQSFAKLQAEAYPDLKPMMIDRPVDEAFEIAREALVRQRLAIVREQPPPERGGAGIIEAFDRTIIVGFYDDVAIRVDGDGKRARIDLRSASRFGRHDLGRNAERMRRLMREIVARLEATVPSLSGDRVDRIRQRLLTTRARGAGQGTTALDKLRGPSRPGAQRELELRGQPRAR